ncbi:MAG: Hint domain-containing protein [Deltaproteobacteria bacterium]|nr:Hint domain-containing protein [Deltaproteobacteria bacterium]
MKARGIRGATTVEYLVLLGAVLSMIATFVLFHGGARQGAACLARRIVGMSPGAACGGAAALAMTAPATAVTGATPAVPGAPVCTRDGCTGTDNCFAGETPVETDRGLVRIDALREGDVVVTKDPDRGAVGQARVTHVHRTLDRPVVDVVLRDAPADLTAHAPRRETITATPEHPFWVVGHGWATVAELSPGMHVASTRGEVEVESVVSRAETRAVYNLEVAGWHVYTVGALGAVVHNTCEVTERARAALGLDLYETRQGTAPRDLVQRLERLLGPVTLPGAPPDFATADTAQLDALARRAAEAWARFGAAAAGTPDRARAGEDYFQAVAAYLAVIEQARRGGDLRFDDQGRVREIRYPNGAITTITWEGVRSPTIELAPPGQPPTRLYHRLHGVGLGRNRYHVDTGRGENDPEAFRGTFMITPTGHVVRRAGSREITTAPDGTVTTRFLSTEYHYLDSTHAGGIRITVSQADNGVRLSVRSTTAGTRTDLLEVPIGTMNLAPRILREENGLILVSLDGSETTHVAVHVSTRPWGEGLAARDRHVPYYDEANLRVVMRALPSGTEAMTVRIALNGREHVQSFPTPLPADTNYILPPRWTPAVSGTWRGSLEPRTGWRRGNQFVADTTHIGRQTMQALEMQVNLLMRQGPIGSIMGLGEAIVGTEASGRWMTPSERVFVGTLSLFGLAADFGPAAAAAAQEARALSGIQTALGVTRAEARGLLTYTRSLPEEQLSILRQVARGRTVPPEQLTPIVTQLRTELARLRAAMPPPTSAAEAATAVARVEAQIAAPIAATPAGGAPATLRQARQLIRSGHGAVHVPAEGADPIALAAGRLSAAGNPVANNTVFRHGRHGEQILRGVLQDSAAEIAALTPGGPAFRTTVRLTETVPGFHSVAGGTPVMIHIREVQVTIVREANGALRLIHFAPQGPAHLRAVLSHQRAALDALRPGERLVRGLEIDGAGAVTRVIGEGAPAPGTTAVRAIFERRPDGTIEIVGWLVVPG